MEITVNGSPETIADPAISIESALKHCKVETPDMVSVQLNGEFVDRTHYGSTMVKDGDEIDFLYFMGGGE